MSRSVLFALLGAVVYAAPGFAAPFTAPLDDAFDGEDAAAPDAQAEPPAGAPPRATFPAPAPAAARDEVPLPGARTLIRAGRVGLPPPPTASRGGR